MLALAASLIPLAGVFQVFDGMQIVSIGVLRGLADTKTPFIISLIGYWLIGMPVGWCFPTGWVEASRDSGGAWWSDSGRSR